MAGSGDAPPRQNSSPELARAARDHQEDVVRSLRHWMFARNMPGNSPDDLGGVRGVHIRLSGTQIVLSDRGVTSGNPIGSENRIS